MIVFAILISVAAVSTLIIFYCSLKLMYLKGRLSALSDARTIMEEGQKELDRIWADKRVEFETILRNANSASSQ